jgi:hypothetical protein
MHVALPQLPLLAGSVTVATAADQPTSRKGQKLKSSMGHMFSALPLTTDIERPRRYVRKVPTAVIAPHLLNATWQFHVARGALRMPGPFLLMNKPSPNFVSRTEG